MCPSHRCGELCAHTALLCPLLRPKEAAGDGGKVPSVQKPPSALRLSGLCRGLVLCPLHGVTTTAANAGVSDSGFSPAGGCVPVFEQAVRHTGLHPVPAPI